MPDREIELLIRSLGINGTYRGYRYLCYGIKLCLEDEDYLLCISKLLYPEIARIFHTSGERKYPPPPGDRAPSTA